MQYLQKGMGYKIDFHLQINTKKFYKLIVLLWVCMVRHAQSSQSNNFIIFLQYFKENVKDGVGFSLLIIVKRFFTVILSFLMSVVKHSQFTESKSFAISLQYLETDMLSPKLFIWNFFAFKPSATICNDVCTHITQNNVLWVNWNPHCSC